MPGASNLLQAPGFFNLTCLFFIMLRWAASFSRSCTYVHSLPHSLPASPDEKNPALNPFVVFLSYFAGFPRSVGHVLDVHSLPHSSTASPDAKNPALKPFVVFFSSCFVGLYVTRWSGGIVPVARACCRISCSSMPIQVIVSRPVFFIISGKYSSR